MKKILSSLVAVIAMALLSSCSLKLQTNEPYDGKPLDPHEYKTAWEFLASHPDLFTSMMEAATLTGVDKYYKQTAETYTFLPFVESAIKDDLAAAKADASLVPALKNLLLFHIIKGDYHGYGTLGYEVIPVETLLGGSDKMTITLDAYHNAEMEIDRVKLMSECGSSEVVYSIGCNHLCTNGPVHILDKKCKYVE